MTEPAAADVAVVAQPVLPLESAHVAEARRALAAQGRAVDDDGIVRLLWVARALPVALDALADAHSAVPLAQAVFTGVDVELGPPAADGRSLLAIGYTVEGGVVVEIVEKRALVLARDDDAPPCCTVRLSLAQEDVGHADGAVSVHRFTVGAPAR